MSVFHRVSDSFAVLITPSVTTNSGNNTNMWIRTSNNANHQQLPTMATDSGSTNESNKVADEVVHAFLKSSATSNPVRLGSSPSSASSTVRYPSRAVDLQTNKEDIQIQQRQPFASRNGSSSSSSSCSSSSSSSSSTLGSNVDTSLVASTVPTNDIPTLAVDDIKDSTTSYNNSGNSDGIVAATASTDVAAAGEDVVAATANTAGAATAGAATAATAGAGAGAAAAAAGGGGGEDGVPATASSTATTGTAIGAGEDDVASTAVASVDVDEDVTSPTLINHVATATAVTTLPTTSTVATTITATTSSTGATTATSAVATSTSVISGPTTASPVPVTSSRLSSSAGSSLYNDDFTGSGSTEEDFYVPGSKSDVSSSSNRGLFTNQTTTTTTTATATTTKPVEKKRNSILGFSFSGNNNK